MLGEKQYDVSLRICSASPPYKINHGSATGTIEEKNHRTEENLNQNIHQTDEFIQKIAKSFEQTKSIL